MTSPLSLVEAIHASGARLCLSICGAGSQALTNLTQVAGCSRTLVFGETLYAIAATRAALDYAPTSLVTPTIARQLAQHAYESGRRLESAAASGPVSPSSSPTPLFGVGATSAVQTNRTRHGRDRVHVCVWGGASAGACDTVTYTVDLAPEASRLQQDAAVANLILHAIADAVHADEGETAAAAATAASGAETSTEQVKTQIPIPHAEAAAAQLAQAVVDGAVDMVLWNHFGEVRVRPRASAAGGEDHPLVQLYGPEGDGTFTRVCHGCPALSSPGGCLQLLYPGSFRPLHWGHTELARAASTVVGRVFQEHSQDHSGAPASGASPPVVVTYELAASVVDKGAASADSLAQRVQQFLARGERIAISPARLFVEKARLFPGHGFIVGIDTVERILDPQYYDGGDEAGMVRALLRDIDEKGCYFVVGGRLASASSQLTAEAKHAAAWQDMSTVTVPEPLRHLFVNIPEKDFRVDVSSTELRARMGIQ